MSSSLCRLQKHLSQMSGIRNDVLAASWEFMLKQRCGRQSKATSSKFLCDCLLTNWTNVTGDTCKREAEREALYCTNIHTHAVGVLVFARCVLRCEKHLRMSSHNKNNLFCFRDDRDVLFQTFKSCYEMLFN